MTVTLYTEFIGHDHLTLWLKCSFTTYFIIFFVKCLSLNAEDSEKSILFYLYEIDGTVCGVRYKTRCMYD